MTNYETLWTPSVSEHECKDGLPSTYSRERGTLIACGDCGQKWYVGYSLLLFEKVWRKVRFFNVNSKRRLNTLGR